ncbi:MAG: glycosyl hydrolase family 18 protein [Sedimentibacter sp.]|uniref:glycoside hydrolase family 18 protein n=1 Tax=Sedimentibacter sp. TaxID=1960295 RepID=UPI003158B0E0
MKKTFRQTIALVIAFMMMLSSGNYAFAAKTDKVPPTAPTNLKTASATNSSVTLIWDASTDNVGVNAYSIYKDGKYLASSMTTAYTADNLETGSTYEFYVLAKDLKRNLSKPSKPVKVTISSESAGSSAPSSGEQQERRVVGYYAAWSSYSGFTPDKLDASSLTHINYAFANIGADFKITMGYPDKDPANFKLLQGLKKANPNLKTLISVGGWTWSGKFSDAASTEANRTAFAQGCVDFITRYGFDGVDLDWEYPVGGGMAGNSKSPADKQNFTLLLKNIREKLDKQGELDNKHYLLTIAGGAGSHYIRNTEPSLFHQYLDYATVMTYDIHGAWDTYADFNAPLYVSKSSPQFKWSLDSSVKAWTAAGFPAAKLVAGVPFYGYMYEIKSGANNGLFQPFSKAKSLSYNTISKNYLSEKGFTRYFHEQSKVPYLSNGKIFISYDDEQSIKYKADYIKDNGLGGAAIWELSQDPNRILLSVLSDSLLR